ncbi:MAG: hypothetical protein MUE46_09300 [Xanthomonadales bacterium]|jgi:hypothetical protein|nr:hypothetical protein [Xanthomonadales bacterium]
MPATPTPAVIDPGTAIVPFWNRLRDIAKYPFRETGLATIAVLTLLVSTLGWFPVGGWIIQLICWIAAYKYAFEILQMSAHGHLEPPETVLKVEGSLVFKYLILQIVLIAVPIIVAYWLSMELAWMLYVLGILIQPAATLLLVMEGRLRAALRPDRWLQLIQRIGWAYLALCALLAVFQGSARNAESLLSELLPALLSRPLVMVCSLWLLFATFHLMGYLIYQYHDALGFAPEAPATRLETPRDRDQQLLDQVGAQMTAGAPDQALALLRAEMAQRAVSPAVHELYRRLLTQAGDRRALLEHGRLFLHLLLLDPRQDPRAMTLARECLDLDGNFTTPEIEDGVKLARRAATRGQARLALELLRAALRTAPKHRDAPEWAADAAEMLLRVPGQEAAARSLLTAMRPRAEGAVQLRIEQLLQGLQSS